MNQSSGMTTHKFTISQEGLKTLSCLTMLIDHIGAVFFPAIRWLRIIGRLSFPLYCFLLVEGIHYTRNPLKYGLRLLLVAILTEIPYDFLFYGQLTLAHNSAMITLLLGFGAGVLMKGRPLWLQCLTAVPFVLAGAVCKGTYGMDGVIMIVLFLLSREMPYRRTIQTLLMILLSLRMSGFPTRIGTQFYAVAAMLPIALYSGEKHSHNKVLQWGFTLFYPLHILILLLIRYIFFA